MMEAVMSYRSRQEYVQTQRARYRSGTRREKKQILDEGCRLFGLHRKSLIRAFGRSVRRPSRRRGRKVKFVAAELLGPLKVIWLASNQPCGKRLKVVLGLWVASYEKHHGALAPDVRERLLAMSPSTLDRLLRPLRARRRGLCGTRRVGRLEGQIPIRTNFRDVVGPGYFEADTVAHGGTSAAGAFVWSMTMTDIWSGWTENAAVWNKNGQQLVRRIRQIEEQLPFDMVAFDSDNGSEFLTWPLHRYCESRNVKFTRSRPCHKNDQAHVEQKQFTHVRQLLGYDRLDNRRLVEPINDLYRHEWRALQNFFLPTVKLISKRRRGGHVKRLYTKPATPYQRLMQSHMVSPEAKEHLRRQFESLDPLELVKAKEAKLHAIDRLVRQGAKGAKKDLLAA